MIVPLADADQRCQDLLAAQHRILEVMARGTSRDVVLNVIAYELEGLDQTLRCVARPATPAEAGGEAAEADGWEVFARGRGGRVVGVLTARPHEPRAPGVDDRLTLEAFARLVAVAVDRGEAETQAAQVAESERRYRRVFEDHPQPMWVYDPETLAILDVNDAAVREYGWTREEFLGLTLRDLRPTWEQGSLDAAMREARDAARASHSHEARHRRKDGSLVQMDVRGHPLEFAGRPARLVVARDLTAQRTAERALRDSEALFRAFVEQASDLVIVLDAAASFQYVSPSATAILGRDPEAMLGRTLHEYLHPGDVALAIAELGAAMRDGQAHRVEIRARHADESWRVLEAIGRVVDLGGESPPRVLVSLRDTTTRHAAEEALRASEERFRSLSASSPLGIFQADLEGGITYVNPRGLQMWETADEAEVLAHRWLERVHPEDVAPLLEGWRATLGAGDDYEHEFRLVMADGTTRWIRGRSACMLDAAGVAVSSVGTIEDVTERRELEGQLRQAQKMEAVGQLAGGIAHDFNNLLTVIKAHTEFLQESVATDDAAHEDVREIAHAAARAAALTRQLLAFSRKQLLRPQALDLNAVLHGMEPMLRRLIGEDVTVAVLPTPEPAVVRADPGQVEQVIMNLALNARDAMPQGGTLALALSHVLVDLPLPHDHGVVQSGAYVLLKVTDTGVGMPEGVRQRVFEPFFTTKGVGKGTGLGLSTVYGIVRQSGGHVTLESVEGAGTTFHVYLPQVATGLTPVLGHEIVAPGGSGTVLLVEDEAPVRSLARRILERRGYLVLEARHGRDAIDIATRHGGTIDLLLTDVVMPGMNGRELADTVTELRPGIRVVFMSGYTDDVIVHRGALSPRQVMVHKPFTTQELAEAVAKAMTR